MVEPVTVPCQECGLELAADSPDLRLELTDDDEPLVYCLECWEREFGGPTTRSVEMPSLLSLPPPQP
jgi:hypothetical protein